MLPYITNGIKSDRKIARVFTGLNQTITASVGDFVKMHNMSSKLFPAATVRSQRSTSSKKLTKPNGIYYKEGLFYIDGTKCYYKDKEITGLQITDEKKTIVGMGAYLVIFPDKKMYNTFDGKIENLEATFTQSATVTFEPLSAKSAYTKITATGIDKIFNKHDGVTISGCTNDTFNTTKVITDSGKDFIVVTAPINEKFTQASGLTFKRTVPDMDFVMEWDNRLWGCSSAKHEIYASKLGDPKNWNCFEGIATDSYAVNVGSDGDFTGCIAHLGYGIFFKENSIHVMYGNKPNNFALNNKTLTGVKKGCEESLEIINETLFYVGRDGVYSYDGALPYKVSETITEPIFDAVTSQQNGTMYISCKMGGKQTILTYSPKSKVWMQEDSTQFKFVSYGNGKLYYVDEANNIRTITGNENEIIKWSFETGEISADILEEKYISKITLDVEMDKNAEFTVFTKCDDKPIWDKWKTIRAFRDMALTIPIIPARCNKFKLKIEGRGACTFKGIAWSVEKGSELHGTIRR